MTIVPRVDRATRRIIEPRRVDARAGLAQMQRARLIVAEMKFSIRIKRQIFAGRVGGQKRHGNHGDSSPAQQEQKARGKMNLEDASNQDGYG